MGNHKLRKEVAALMKKQGVQAKLYRGRKRGSLHALPAYVLHNLQHKLSFDIGELVNDCDGFNHRIVKRLVRRYKWRGVDVFHFDQFEFEDGIWSCGCSFGPEKAWTVEQIRKFHLRTSDEIEYEKKHGWWSERDQKLQDALEKGEPICDEDGLPSKEKP